jgi:hypothetical protein
MATKRLLYAATPIEGKALVRANYEVDVANRGIVPYFVSGPLARSGSVGYLGTILHVGSWVAAMIFELSIMPQLDSTTSPAAYTLWLYGFLAISIGLGVLLLITALHYCSRPENRIPEGGLPPFLMTLFIGGAQISLLFSVLQLLLAGNGVEGLYFNYPNGTVTDQAKQDYRMTLLRLTAFSMMFKVYIVQFLRNNQVCIALQKFSDIYVVTPFLSCHSHSNSLFGSCRNGPAPPTSSRSCPWRPPRSPPTRSPPRRCPPRRRSERRPARQTRRKKWTASRGPSLECQWACAGVRGRPCGSVWVRVGPCGSVSVCGPSCDSGGMFTPKSYTFGCEDRGVNVTLAVKTTHESERRARLPLFWFTPPEYSQL